MSTISPRNVLNFASTLGKLKTLKRTGWVNNDVQLPESVADHMYRMSMLSFAITDLAINKEHLMKLCLVHDLAESIVGDITPHDNVTSCEKRILEENALRKIANDLDYSPVSNDIIETWLEYETGSSTESQIAHQLDKFEMIVQAEEYEIAQGKILDDFFASTEGYFSHPEIASWDLELRQRRKIRLTNTTH